MDPKSTAPGPGLSACATMTADPGRLDALRSYDILDSERDRGFDDIVEVASALCRTPVALVSLVAEDRQWFKSAIGVDMSETPIEQSVCAYGLSQGGLLIIPDLTLDPRTATNSLVAAEGGIRFYAGAPLITPAGWVLGMLCAIDLAPRPEGLDARQQQGLKALARLTMQLIETRKHARARAEREAAE